MPLFRYFVLRGLECSQHQCPKTITSITFSLLATPLHPAIIIYFFCVFQKTESVYHKINFMWLKRNSKAFYKGRRGGKKREHAAVVNRSLNKNGEDLCFQPGKLHYKLSFVSFACCSTMTALTDIWVVQNRKAF